MIVNGLAAGQQTNNQTQPSTKFPTLSTAEIIHSELLSSGREPFDSNQPAGTPVCSMLSLAPRMRQGQKTALQHKSLSRSAVVVAIARVHLPLALHAGLQDHGVRERCSHRARRRESSGVVEVWILHFSPTHFLLAFRSPLLPITEQEFRSGDC